MEQPENRKESASEQTKRMPPKSIKAEQLLQGAREVWIEHAGVRYRLRVTRRNKLILQK
jgi:hemin uptake protein HemP